MGEKRRCWMAPCEPPPEHQVVHRRTSIPGVGAWRCSFGFFAGSEIFSFNGRQRSWSLWNTHADVDAHVIREDRHAVALGRRPALLRGRQEIRYPLCEPVLDSRFESVVSRRLLSCANQRPNRDAEALPDVRPPSPKRTQRSGAYRWRLTAQDFRPMVKACRPWRFDSARTFDRVPPRSRRQLAAPVSAVPGASSCGNDEQISRICSLIQLQCLGGRNHGSRVRMSCGTA
jgi:hypothetical protein